MSAIECAFLGTLGRDAEARTSKTGRAYLRLSVRVGNDDAAQWLSALVFDQSAVDLVETFTRGARCYIEGKLSLTEWADSNGKKRTGLSVLAWHCRLSEIGRHRTKRRVRREPEPPPAAGATFFDDSIPF